ncbi:TerC family protein [Stenoxybacter acetivorans]|uniref:TerC family protein n=1 Tax=Stenoxybacter acetivorans TaxID=422441 RepID=UPI001B8093AC|nr:TerC family protein [Stenoxybacter acetivorans]
MQHHVHTVGTPMFYAVFFAVILVMIAIDMLALKKEGVHKVSTKEALIWSVTWVTVSMAFALWLYFRFADNPAIGSESARDHVLLFITAYVLEKSLAVDNIFVFVMIFSYFKIPAAYQHRVLLYGVFGAIILRTILVGFGAVLVGEFKWILYFFGAFLIYSGLKMMVPSKEEDPDFEHNRLIQWLTRHMRISKNLDREKFFTIENGKRLATPLLLVLIMVELSDVIFAVDSIPAVFAVTTDPFIALTSNLFAVLGLRAMYFLLANVVERFAYLQYGLAFVLTFIGVKMLISHWFHIPVTISLAVIFTALILSVAASWVFHKPDEA